MEEDTTAKGLRQNLWEIFGTDQVGELREIAKKARSYDRIIEKRHPANLRGAGRKGKFTDQEVDLMIELYQQGKTVQYLAERFDTSRQTVAKYLAPEKRFVKNPFLTVRMHYLYQDQVCTVIDVDFMHKKVYIRNKTRDIIHRAFGIVEEPSWEDFEDFLESRCFPRGRANLKNILRDLGISSYDPLQIIEKTGGKMAEDHQWIQIFYKGNGLRRPGGDGSGAD